jgi:translation initiation factor 3 subunit F
VHPVVVMSIVDHHSRRAKSQKRVIGTLLGSISGDGVVDVRDSFAVPHTEGDKVAVDMQYYHTMLALHQRGSPGLAIVGWYASGGGITDTSAMFHGFFVGLMPGTAPVHLLVDTSLAELKLSVTAYVGVSLTLGHTVGSLFEPIETTLAVAEADKIALAMVTRAVDGEGDEPSSTTVADLTNVNVGALLRRIHGQLQRLYDHATAVVEGKTPANADVGAALLEVIQALPAIQADEFERILTGGVDDLLMVAYLAKAARLQLTLVEQIEQI